MARNGGPSAARNRGIGLRVAATCCRSTPTTCSSPTRSSGWSSQLQAAGEHVGFIYQNCQYFGNREDYFEPPVVNPLLLAGELHRHLRADRSQVFDQGFPYAEDIVFGHEDWDFFLE